VVWYLFKHKDNFTSSSLLIWLGVTEKEEFKFEYREDQGKILASHSSGKLNLNALSGFGDVLACI
jgi:hypothetical protein